MAKKAFEVRDWIITPFHILGFTAIMILLLSGSFYFGFKKGVAKQQHSNHLGDLQAQAGSLPESVQYTFNHTLMNPKTAKKGSKVAKSEVFEETQRKNKIQEQKQRLQDPPKIDPAVENAKKVEPKEEVTTKPVAETMDRPKSEKSAPPTYILQVGAFRDKTQANQLISSLGKKGHRAYLGPTHFGSDGKYYRVWIGEKWEKEKAEQMKLKLREQQFQSAFLIQNK